MTDAEFDKLEEQRWERRKLCDRISDMAPWLADDIAACMEAAYRRGFQQGAYRRPDDGLIADWRFKPFGDPTRYRTAETPPNCSGPSESALARHSSEASNVSTSVAQLLDTERSRQAQVRRLNKKKVRS